jgi:hypothetical protein
MRTGLAARQYSESQDSSDGIVTGWAAQVRFSAVQGFTVHSVQTDSGAHPASYPVGTWVKRQGREADHSHLSSVKVKERWTCTSILPYAFMA